VDLLEKVTHSLVTSVALAKEVGTMYESVQCSCGATVSFGATDSCSVGLALILFDMPYYEVPADILENKDLLGKWAKRALGVARKTK